MSSLNISAAKGGLPPVSSPGPGSIGQGKPEGSASAASFAALHAERVGVTPAAAEAPLPKPAETSAMGRPLTLGDAILNTMDRMGQSAREHWKHVAAPLNPAVGFNSADLLNRQMHLQRFMLEVEFASLLSKQAAKTVDQISRTQ
ncbi:hypothetical protein ACFJGX_09205 [Hydrogenophaga sp. UC242_50]